ncbi:MAG: hypothetical protein IJY46_03915 [Lentisphaeria bacterium]|nr:hypothetical protein [Lentisphaeria bacterium]
MADFEIADGSKQLECVVTVPCLLRRSSGKLEIQVESDDTPEQPMTPLESGNSASPSGDGTVDFRESSYNE